MESPGESVSKIYSPHIYGTQTYQLPATQVLAAGSRIQPRGVIIPISSNSSVTLTSSPAIATGVQGQEILIWNAGQNAITLPSNGLIFSTGSTQQIINPNDLLRFYYLGGNWIQETINKKLL